MTKRDHGIGPVPEEVSEPLRDFLNQMRRLVMGGLRSGALSGTSTAAGGSSGGASTIIIGGSGSGSYTPDLTPPPTPTGVTVSTGFASVFFETDEPTFTQGNGYQRTYVYGATYSGTGPLPTFSSAVKVHEFVGAVGSMPANLGTQWHFWLKWLSNDDVLSTSPSGGANGHQVTIGRVGHSDLGPLIVEADNLADGTVTAAKVAAQAISLTKFANGIEPVTIVTGSTVPTTKSTNAIFLTGTGKLYRWDGSAYVASVPTSDLSGSIVQAQIADGAINTAKFATGIEPVSVVSSLPGALTTRSVFLTTDGKLYRWSGSAYVASVPAVDVTGQLTDTQLASIAAAKVSGQLTDAQLAAISAAKVTGQLADSQIAAVAAAKLTGQITSTQITDGSISTPKLAAGAVTASTIAAGAVVADKIGANAVTAAKIEAGAVTTAALAAGAVTAGTIAAGAVTTAKLSAGAVTANEIAAGAVVADKIGANAVTAAKIEAGAVTTAKLAANAVTANELAANSVIAGKIQAGAVSTAEIAAGAVNTAKLAADAVTASQIAAGAVTTVKLAAAAVTANELAANAVTADKILANAVTAGKIAAGAVGADQIAAGAVTTGKLLVTGRGKAINDDPGMRDPTAWTQTSGSTPIEFAPETTAPYGNYVLRATGQTTVWSRSMPTAENTRFKVSIWGRKISGTGSLYVRAMFFDVSNALVNYIVTALHGGGNLEGLTIGSGWTQASGYIVAGSAAKTMVLEVDANWGGDGISEFTDFRIEEYIGADLIVDGAIIASKIAAGAIAAGSAAIADGAIRNALIENAAVDSAKIADAAVVSAKIADAAITNAKVANAAIKLANIDVATITQLSALSAYLGSVEIATTGSLRSGATGFDAGTGWWQGIDGGAAKFYMGSSAINVIWDGTQLAVRRNGLVVAPALCYIVSASASTSTGSSATLTFKRNGEIAKSSNGGSKTTVGYWYYPTSTAAGDGMALDVINSATGASVLSTNSISGDMDVTLSVPSGGGGGTSIAFYDYIIYPHFGGAGDGFASFGRFILKARTVPV